MPPPDSAMSSLDAVTKPTVETIGAAGVTVELYGQDGQNVVEAVNK